MFKCFMSFRHRTTSLADLQLWEAPPFLLWIAPWDNSIQPSASLGFISSFYQYERTTYLKTQLELADNVQLGHSVGNPRGA